MAPWEYRTPPPPHRPESFPLPPPPVDPLPAGYTDSGASACNCRDPIEHRSESFATTSDAARNYIQALVINRLLRPNGLPHGNPGRPRTSPQKQLSSCVYFRSGYAFQNADLTMVTPLLQGASSVVNLTLLSRESNVPFFPGASREQEEVCGGMGITERINKCFFGLLDDFSDTLLPSEQDIVQMSATCASTNDELIPTRQTCCHKIKVYTNKNQEPELRSIIRLDMVRRPPPPPAATRWLPPADRRPPGEDARRAVPPRQGVGQLGRRPDAQVPADCVLAAARGRPRRGNHDARPLAGRRLQNPQAVRNKADAAI